MKYDPYLIILCFQLQYYFELSFFHYNIENLITLFNIVEAPFKKKLLNFDVCVVYDDV